MLRALILSLALTLAASAAEPVSIGDTHKIHSAVLNEDRPYMVRLPSDYAVSGERYPVLYLLDAESHFTHVAGTASYLMDQGEIPQMIIVGLTSAKRVRDFTQTDWPQAWIGGGGAAKYQAFVAKEFIPEIEKTYRTDGYRIVAGHSASGQFSLYCLETQPTLFQAYLVLSPSLDWDGGLPARGLEQAFDKKPAINAFAFMGRCNDRGEALAQFDKLVDVFKTKAPAGVRWASKAYDNETHGSVALVGMIDALRALYAGWRVPEEVTEKGLPAVEAYFAGLSKTYGRAVALTENVVNDLAYAALERKQAKEAVALFQRNVAAHPGSANAYDGLADGFAADGQLEAAVQAEGKSVELARKASHPSLANFEKRLKKHQDALAAAKKADPASQAVSKP